MKCKDCDNYDCLRRGNGEDECFYDEELRIGKEAEETKYWQSFRNQAAKDILCAMLSNSNLGYYGNEVDNAVIYADKLIAKLKEKEEK